MQYANKHRFVDDDLIYNSIHELNTRFNVDIDPSHFFEEPMSDYCTAEVKDNKLKLIFPVAASAKYAEVVFDVEDSIINTNSLSYNNAFDLEIKENL
mgnify:CR=1 FL=1|tara:strand:- start:1326 stop:1616 length:291 start_codon:yes stop_codon:yes gene_type:complete